MSFPPTAHRHSVPLKRITRRTFGLLMVGFVVAACQQTTALPPEATHRTGWVNGSTPVSSDVIQTFVGPQHCDEQNSVLLVLGWPLGTAQNMVDARWYIRNPPEFVLQLTTTSFSADVMPPPDARFTGYRNNDLELWLAPSDQDQAAYLKTGDRFERWPLSRQALMCM